MTTRSDGKTTTVDHQVAIIGTGFAGIAMAHHLDQRGITDFVLFEKADRVGGTWRDNHYPGARCDVPAALYSLSFAPEWSWSSNYPPQPEILAYMERTAERQGVTLRTRFKTEIVNTEYDDTTGIWTLTDSKGKRTTCRVLVSAVGQLNRPAIPNVRGRDSFTGTAFHSAEWRHDISLSGKTVAVVGTGASAIQIVPAIAPEVGKLVLLQRSPAWVFPKPERDIPLTERLNYRLNPDLLKAQRDQLYEEFEIGFDKYIADTPLNIALREVSRTLIEKQIADPELRRKVTPDYTPGCKRILASNDWYSTLARDNVDVRTAGLKAIEGDELIDTEGNRHKADVVVYATGFRSIDFLHGMKVKGAKGADLHQVWNGEPEAYLGVCVPDFPNFFMMYGPNTNTHNSIIGMLEAQGKYIAGKAEMILRGPVRSIAVRPEAMQAFYDRIAPDFEKFAWSGACHNWYRTESGRVVNNWPARSRPYAELLERDDSDNFIVWDPAGMPLAPAVG